MKEKDKFSAVVTNTSTSQPGILVASVVWFIRVFLLHIILEPHRTACGIKVTVFPAS